MAEENGTTTETKTNNPNTYTINGEIYADKIYYKNSNKYIEYLNSNNIENYIGKKYVTLEKLNTELKNVATINDQGSSENDTYSSSKINKLISNLEIISDPPELLTFTRSGNKWTATLSSDSKIITKDDSENLILNDITSDKYLKSSKLITRKLSFRNNDTTEKTTILKAYNNYTKSDIEIILPAENGTLALTKDIPSFKVDDDGYLNIKTNDSSNN